ncbi:glycerate kinase [Melghirimyces profundicolus]|uniref:Glycerate kinase n=1 Tax=Melghirimyces profundicolus TaxID=1242148 RepID=A0A2T6C4K9_9BACL|nr:glycerate kinase [Melghirimyces profundicolus]PTX63254.1 glycerate kinase [Melghirimyces profundicolus]
MKTNTQTIIPGRLPSVYGGGAGPWMETGEGGDSSVKVVVAPDSFKGSMTSREAAERIQKGIRQVFPDWTFTALPMADGGEGTVDAVLAGTGGRKIPVRVKDPLGREVEAELGYCEERKLAVIETAAASGLDLLKEGELDPVRTSTFGTGQLMKHALDLGVEEVILGLGGSATVDAGTGFFTALGVRFLDREGHLLEPAGGKLGEIEQVDLSGMNPGLKSVRLTVASDVTNPLLGPEGAVRVFGPQKGVRKDDLDRFEAGMEHYAEALVRATGRDHRSSPGSGAAGGFGFSLRSLLDVRFESGFERIANLVGLEERIREAGLVITGEGKVDHQSLYGKVPVGISRIALRHGVPVVVFAGSVEGDLTEAAGEGISVVFPIVNRPLSLGEAMDQGPQLLETAARRFARVWQLSGTG